MVDLAAPVPRRRLRDLTLRGPRAIVRQVLFAGIAVCAVMAVVGYLLPAHQLDDEAIHSNYADGGPAALVALGVVALGWLRVRRAGFGAGVLYGLAGLAAGFVALVAVFLVHLFARNHEQYGEWVFAVGVLGLWLLGPVTAIAEPVLHLLERRALERAEAPVFPTATARPRRDGGQ